MANTAIAVPAPTSSTAPPTIEIRTKVLYGVVATEKSFLVGIRKLVKRQHAHMISFKILQHILPPELVHMISMQLFQMESDDIDAAWKKDVPHRDNVRKFRYDMARTPAEKTMLERTHAFGVNAVAVRTSNPRDAHGNDTGGTSCYVHLSSSPRRPEMTRHLIGEDWTLPGVDGYRYSSLKQAGMTCSSDNPHYDVQRSIDHISGSCSSYQPDHRGRSDRPTSGEVTTMSMCVGIEDAIQNWDAKAIRSYASLLDLEMISSSNNNTFQPALSIWQFFSDR